MDFSWFTTLYKSITSPRPHNTVGLWKKNNSVAPFIHVDQRKEFRIAESGDTPVVVGNDRIFKDVIFPVPTTGDEMPFFTPREKLRLVGFYAAIPGCIGEDVYFLASLRKTTNFNNIDCASGSLIMAEVEWEGGTIDGSWISPSLVTQNVATDENELVIHTIKIDSTSFDESPPEYVLFHVEYQRI